MLSWLKRKARIYGAFAANTVKLQLAYSVWFWVDFFGQILMMMIVIYFWRAVYSNSASVGGMNVDTTITYILFAQMVAPLVRWSWILDFGFWVREGQIAIELTRPVDFQGKAYVEWLTSTFVLLLRQSTPLFLIGWLFFGLKVPTDPRIWGSFVVSLILGNAVMFLFDWTYGQLAFYTTEVWGLHILREGVATFFSGSLIPLAMLPGWLQKVAAAMPFGQTLNTPVSILAGITPVEQAPHIWFVQSLWVLCLFVVARVAFAVASRKVTVQGG